ncbi:protein phosphatase 2A regulatory subunit PR55, partial [Kipferlia bialata]
IFDKFSLSQSWDGRMLLSGSYSNYFHVYDRSASAGVRIEASRTACRRSYARSKSSLPGSALGAKLVLSQGRPTADANVELDTEKKVLHCEFHPSQSIMAVSTRANLYIYASLDNLR